MSKAVAVNNRMFGFLEGVLASCGDGSNVCDCGFGGAYYPKLKFKSTREKVFRDGLIEECENCSENMIRVIRLTSKGVASFDEAKASNSIKVAGVRGGGDHERGGEADPIKSISDVNTIYGQLRRMGYYREAELFMIGCNCALRISDLLQLRSADIERKEYNGQTIGFIKKITEKKTGKTKELTINHVGMKHVDILMNLFPENNYLFESEWGRKRNRPPAPVTSQHVWKVFKTVSDALMLDYRFSTHSMRKTFGYYAYQSGVDIEILRKLLNHSSSSQTLAYIGINNEAVKEVYLTNVIGVGVGG